MDDLIERLRRMDGDSMSIKTLDEAAARIEALEACVAAAEVLADEMTRLMRRTPFVPAPNGIAVTITLDQIADQKAALAAYEATKEQSE